MSVVLDIVKQKLDRLTSRPEMYKRFNRMLFDKTKQDRMQIFKGILFFKP